MTTNQSANDTNAALARIQATRKAGEARTSAASGKLVGNVKRGGQLKNTKKAKRAMAEAQAIVSGTSDVQETAATMRKADKTAKAGSKADAKRAKTAKEPKAKKPVPMFQGIVVRKNGALSAKGLTCLCGCGTPTVTEEARFVSGHDAKLRKLVLAENNPKKRVALLPEIVRPFFEHGEAIGGLEQRDGQIVDLKAEADEDDSE